MKKALIIRFLSVIMIALTLSGAISYYFMADNLLKSNIESMKMVLKAVDHEMNYDKNLGDQATEIVESITNDKIRITIIDL